MNAVWSMTSLESGRFNPGERRSELRDLAHDFNELRSRDQGYLEVRLPDTAFPQVTLGFRGGHAVIHLFADAENGYLLVGDGSVSPEDEIDVPIMDDLAVFTGGFILSVDRAWDVVRNFVQSGEFDELGEWYEL